MFKLNDIIRDVDPVKLYEYISMGKPVISVYYKEVNQFRDFVFFYHSPDELIRIVDALMQKEMKQKYNYKNQQEFLKENNWEKRYEDIKQYMK